jgi:hypothetical protein
MMPAHAAKRPQREHHRRRKTPPAPAGVKRQDRRRSSRSPAPARAEHRDVGGSTLRSGFRSRGLLPRVARRQPAPLEAGAPELLPRGEAGSRDLRTRGPERALVGLTRTRLPAGVFAVRAAVLAELGARPHPGGSESAAASTSGVKAPLRCMGREQRRWDNCSCAREGQRRRKCPRGERQRGSRAELASTTLSSTVATRARLMRSLGGQVRPFRGWGCSR